MAFAMLGDGDKAGALFSHAQPDQSRPHARRRPPLQGGALRRRRRRLRHSRRTSGAAAGPGTPARRAGCTAPASRAILGFRLRGRRSCIDPCIPKAWPGFEIAFRYHSTRYEIAVENPRGVSRGVVHAELDGVALTGDQTRIPLRTTVRPIAYRVVLG